MEEFVCAMPKAELHVHIEGTLEGDLVFKLAKRNKVPLTFQSVAELEQAKNFTDLQSFLNLYYLGTSVLKEKDDFFELAFDYFKRAKADNVVHTEPFFDPQSHTERGVAFGTIMEGLLRASQKAELELGMSVKWIMCILRHRSEDDGLTTLKEAMPFLEHIAAIGLDSSERDNPPEKFARLFSEAKKLGLRCVAHAGEEGPARNVQLALDTLGVQRIDHGVHSLDDNDLVRRLARQRIPLTVCPLSNVRLRVCPSIEHCAVLPLLRQGVVVTINSDDPAYFGGYLNENFRQLVKAVPQLTKEDFYILARNSFEASFLDLERKAAFLERLRVRFNEVITSKI